jgi:hypothetical protein
MRVSLLMPLFEDRAALPLASANIAEIAILDAGSRPRADAEASAPDRDQSSRILFCALFDNRIGHQDSLGFERAGFAIKFLYLEREPFDRPTVGHLSRIGLRVYSSHSDCAKDAATMIDRPLHVFDEFRKSVTTPIALFSGQWSALIIAGRIETILP